MFKLDYKLANGGKLEIEVPAEIFYGFKNNKFTKARGIYKHKYGYASRKRIYYDTFGAYIVWNNERVYLENFKSFTKDEIVHKFKLLQKNNQNIILYREDLFSFLMRHYHEIILVGKVSHIKDYFCDEDLKLLKKKNFRFNKKMYFKLSLKDFKQNLASERVPIIVQNENYKSIRALDLMELFHLIKDGKFTIESYEYLHQEPKGIKKIIIKIKNKLLKKENIHEDI